MPKFPETRLTTMRDEEKTQEQLLAELRSLRSELARHEKTDTKQGAGGQTATEELKGSHVIQEGEARYRAIVEDHTELVTRFLPDGTLIFVNGPYCRFFGESQSELVGQSFWHHVHDEDLTKLKTFLDSFDPQNIVGTIEHRVMDSTGEVRWLQWTDRASFDESGQLTGFQGVGRDITERKRTEEALQKSEEKFRSLFTLERDAIFVIDRKTGAILDVNNAACELYGYTREEMLTLKHNDMSAEPWEPDRAAKEFEDRTTFRWHKKKDRTVFPVDISSSLLVLNDREIIQAAVRDMSERRQMEETLRENEERFRVTFDNSPLGAAIAGSDFRFLRVNEELCRFVGYSADELIESVWMDITHPEDIDADMEKARRLVAGEIDHYSIEKRYIRKDGQVVWGRLFVRAVRNSDGVPYCYLPMVIDITEGKRTEKALRESESRFRALFENAPLPYQSLDEKGYLLEVNQMWLEKLGYEKKEVLGRWFGDFLADGFVEHFDRNFPMFKEACAIDGVEFDMVKKNGETIHVSFNGRVQLDGSRRFVCTHCIFVDITERKRAEGERERLQSQLLQAQKMESVGRLAGGVAHDFNNMLGVIIGHAEMAKFEVDSNQSIHADLEEILKAANRSAGLTRQLLAFARKQTISPRVLDLNQTLEGILNILRRLIGEDIRLVWKPGPKLWTVKTDPSQIDQILANLCVNARDAIAGVGTVTIETRNVVFEETDCLRYEGLAPGDYVLLRVSDDGCGMERQLLDHIFEPFFTTKEVGKGTGLGLATVYGIVKQNNGFIYAQSEPGAGTTFSIYLPRSVVDSTQKRPFETEQRDLRGTETVLVVEDEESILALAKAILDSHGYAVLAAKSPGDALNLAKSHPGPIHLLITDVVMPEMNGKDLSERLSASRPRIKSMFMSGYTDEVIARNGVLDEGTHFLQKPFSPKVLTEKVREMLDS